MENWYEEDYEYEPEPVIDLPETQSVNVALSINAGQIELAIQKHLNDLVEPRIKKMIGEKINDHMKKIISDKYWGEENLKNILYDVIEKRVLKKYPDVVENKVNELYEGLMKTKFTSSRGSVERTMQERAMKKVNQYIDDELVKSVSKSREYIEQFAKNYFANNLFRAMGMMDKMLPQTKVGQDGS